VVLLHKYDELGYDQIARSLGCSVQAVKSLMFRAHENLRTQLAHLGPEA
jgi:DNA-directed RNA polymerase specialized sigma24 family protein